MAMTDREDADARRTYHRELRNVGRLLRWTGILMVLVGTVGIALGRDGAWFLTPAWVSFTLGWALVLSGVVSRSRHAGIGDEPD